MGLDMYARASRTRIWKQTDFPVAKDDELLSCWRKHPNLHGWMADLYDAKGGTDDSFDMVPVQLTIDDLDALETAVSWKRLPHTTGFFFGTSYCNEQE